MREIHETLCEVYGAERAVVVPGGGTYAMESVARQFATGKKAMVIRNGFFSYRWTQIFEAGSIPAEEIVLKARRTGNGGADAPVRAAADRGSGRADREGAARLRVRPACRDRLGHHPARRLHQGGGRRGARRRRAVRARLHRLGHASGST